MKPSTNDVIEKQSDLLGKLINLIDSVLPSEIIPSSFLPTNSPNLEKKLINIETLIQAGIRKKSALRAIFAVEDAQNLTQLLVLLQRHGLCSEENIKGLVQIKDSLGLVK